MASYTVRSLSPFVWAWRLRGVNPEPRGVALTKAMAKRAAERAAGKAAVSPPPPGRRPDADR